MKKLFIIMLCLALAGTLLACGGPSDDEIKAVRSVTFEGTELTVALGANKSTGYEWDYEIYGDCIEPSLGRSFKITGSKGDATGEEITGFTGTSAGTAVIVFTTPYGWDGTGAGDGYTVNVEVAADGKILSAGGNAGANAPQLMLEQAPEQTPEPASAPTAEPAPEPSPKTAVAIDELKEGTYTGTMSGGEFTNNEGTIFTTLLPADVTLTIENGQITFFSEGATDAYGILNGVKTPEAPDSNMIFNGSLLLAQSGDAVTAAGELTSSGKSSVLHYTDGKFDRWELKERSGNGKYPCSVHIAMTDGAPVATITVDIKGDLSLTATVPLALKGESTTEPLSAPYADMLKRGDYQYTYSLEYEGKPYSATIAMYDGMICRNIVSDDGTFSQRVITKDGHAWRVDDLTGAVVDGGTVNAETLPDYAATLTFAASKTLDTGAIADAYDFEIAGQKSNMVFLFTPEGKLVALIATVGDQTSEMDILHFSSVGNDQTLFDVPQ